MLTLKRLCPMATLVLAVSCLTLAMPENRSYVSGNYFMNLGNAQCGFLKSVEGGAISAEVIREPAGPSYFVKKHIGQPKYQEFTVQVGFSMDKSLYEWIAQSWKMKYERKDGSIAVMDYTLTPKSERQFQQALITETTIPAVDGSSKEPAYMTVKFAPQIIREVATTGQKTDYGTLAKNEQKGFIPCNFRFEIDGIDCSKVTKVDSFTVRQTTVTDNIGDARDHQKEPGKLEFPNLKLLVSEAGAQGFLDWHKSFVIEGNNDDGREKSGMLTLLTANQKEALLRIKFYNVGIIKASPAKAEANADAIRQVEVELYVERMELLYGGQTGETAPAAPATPPAAPRNVRRG